MTANLVPVLASRESATVTAAPAAAVSPRGLPARDLIARLAGRGRVMGFRKISYLIPSCDGCGLAWSFGDLACAEGIPPHFASRVAALAQLPADYGWQIRSRRVGRPLMACRRCSAAGVVSATAGRAWLLAAAGRIRRLVPFGPVRRRVPAGLGPGHPESMTAVLPAAQEGLLAKLDAEIFPDRA